MNFLRILFAEIFLSAFMVTCFVVIQVKCFNFQALLAQSASRKAAKKKKKKAGKAMAEQAEGTVEVEA